MKEILLIGMPNCGKSSLFYLLTGHHTKTGNRAGVTVRGESVQIRLPDSPEEIRATDLPGIRSFPPTSEDERVTAQALSAVTPESRVLFVCDCTDFERQYPLFCKIIGFFRASGKPVPPVALLLNFCDRLSSLPDTAPLSLRLGCPVLCVSARTRLGEQELKRFLRQFLPAPVPDCCKAFCKAGCRNTAQLSNLPSAAEANACLRLSARPESAAARTADRLLCSPSTGFFLFFAILLSLLFLVFGPVGNLLTEGFCSLLLTPLFTLTERLTKHTPLPVWMPDFLECALLRGVGAILEFFPRLTLLFLFQSIAEQTGLLSRFARLWDRPMSRFGLRGDAMTPLLLGFGCSIPAIYCTRGMKDRKAADRCACFLPAVACSARLPLCQVLSGICFPGGGWWVCCVIWCASALCFLLLCAVLHRLTDPDRAAQCHRDPLPRWQLPSAREIGCAVREHLLHFLGRAGGIILLTSLLIWLLASVSPQLKYIGMSQAENSLLASLGQIFSTVLIPLGFGSWQIAAALIAGIGAKESALSTLSILLGSSRQPLLATLTASGLLTRPGALSLLVFYTLYFPCTATVAVLRGENKPLRPLLLLPLLSYLLAFLTYRISLLAFP